jgi:hypothetical protein
MDFTQEQISTILDGIANSEDCVRRFFSATKVFKVYLSGVKRVLNVGYFFYVLV